jgi:hypothetical protein
MMKGAQGNEIPVTSNLEILKFFENINLKYSSSNNNYPKKPLKDKMSIS